MLNASFLWLFQPSLKKIFFSLLLSSFTATIYGTFCGKTIIAGSAFIGFMLTILLFVDRKNAVNEQTTNGDMIATGVVLMILLPLCVSIIVALAIGSLILGIGFEQKFSGTILLLFATPVIYYLIRIASRFFEKKNWKLVLDQ